MSIKLSDAFLAFVEVCELLSILLERLKAVRISDKEDDVPSAGISDDEYGRIDEDIRLKK